MLPHNSTVLRPRLRVNRDGNEAVAASLVSPCRSCYGACA
jgi:hypothetical protein